MLAKSVLTKEEAEKIAIPYAPRKFQVQVSQVAYDYMTYASESENPEFHISSIVADQSGITELERLSLQEKVERGALEKVKEIQEDAYNQAYQLGLDEGREHAFQEHHAKLEGQIASLEFLLNSLSSLKQELVNSNEPNIVKLVYYLASRVAMKEIKEDPALIVPLIQNYLQEIQEDEQVKVKISVNDFQFVESIKERLSKDFEKIKHVKFEATEQISPGGCIIETNYGIVDATVEQRIEKLWSAVSEKIPEVQETIVASGMPQQSDGDDGQNSGEE